MIYDIPYYLAKIKDIIQEDDISTNEVITGISNYCGEIEKRYNKLNTKINTAIVSIDRLQNKLKGDE
jgi:hypothetical protein